MASAGANSRLAAGRKKLEEYKLKRNPAKTKEIENDTGKHSSAESALDSLQYNDENTTTSDSNFFDSTNSNESSGQNENVGHRPPFTNGSFVNAPDLNEKVFQLENDDSSEDGVSSMEVAKLKQQLQFHMQTVEFLVSEKNNLTAKVNELEGSLSKMKSLNDDVSGRLNISRHRASCLEMEYSNLKDKMQELNVSLSHAQQENSKYKDLENSYKNQCGELKEELQEKKSLINNQICENNEMKKRIEELTFVVNATELRFQQLSQGYSQTTNNGVAEQNQILVKQLDELNRQMRDLEIEKNQSNAQYQQYVQQLNAQLESVSQKHEAVLLENENLMNRESNLIQQMDSLEKQLQTMMRVKPEVKQIEVPNSEVRNETKTEETMEMNENLKAALKEKENLLQTYMNQIEKNQDRIDELNSTINLMQHEKMDIAKLNAAIESDRIAAQKATAQNTKLKTDLDSLQEAYKKMTESKLEMAELLQAEKNLSRTLTLTLADNEEKLKDVNSKLYAKDEEMIRLQAESSVLEKQALQRIHNENCHDHDHNHSDSKVDPKESTDLLDDRLKILHENNEKLINIILKHGISLEEDDQIKNLEDVERAKEVLVEEDFNTNADENIAESTNKTDSCMHIPAGEAIKILQKRFTKLMDDVANLSDDKQRLEHLVIQLQGETETIGEYIALYQKQRSILKQREYEKDIQLNLLTQEKNKLKLQLEQLDALIGKLVNQMRTASNHSDTPVSNGDGEINHTATQIANLLSEIKENHLVNSAETSNLSDNFQPCSWCSGKLINL